MANGIFSAAEALHNAALRNSQIKIDILCGSYAVYKHLVKASRESTARNTVLVEIKFSGIENVSMVYFCLVFQDGFIFISGFLVCR